MRFDTNAGATDAGENQNRRDRGRPHAIATGMGRDPHPNQPTQASAYSALAPAPKTLHAILFVYYDNS